MKNVCNKSSGGFEGLLLHVILVPHGRVSRVLRFY